MIQVNVRDTANNVFAHWETSSFEEALYLAKLWVRDGFHVEIVPVVTDLVGESKFEESE